MANIFGYLTRSAEQVEEALRIILPTELPEITDFENDLLVRSFKIWANMNELLQYYIDNVARESNVMTAELYASLVQHARSVDYRVRSVKPCEVVLQFTLSTSLLTNVVIPQGTIVKNEDDIAYLTIQAVTIIAGTTQINAPAIQKTVITNELIGTTNGQASQVLLMPDSVVDGSVRLTINGEEYTPVDTYYYSLPDSLHFIQTVSTDTNNHIVLGDGVNGKLPTANQSIYADYETTLGKAGKAGKHTLTTVGNPPTVIGATLTCTNPSEAFGGEDFEGIEALRKNIPLFNRTVERAVSREAYISLASLVQGVAKAGLYYNSGTIVKIFIVPEGGGIASPTFLAQVQAYMQQRIIICTQVQVESAGEIEVLLTFEVNLLPTANRIETEALLRANLIAFGSLELQEISGEMSSGNLNQVVCNTRGVQSCVLQVFSVKPYPRPTTSDTALNWSVSLLAGSTAKNTWRIVFLSTSTFQLFREDAFVGNYTVNVAVVQPEASFTILQNYSIGLEWQFVTYPYLGDRAGKYDIDEPAILRISDANITLNLIGGL